MFRTSLQRVASNVSLTLCAVRLLSVNVVAQELLNPIVASYDGTDTDRATSERDLKLAEMRSAVDQGLRCQDAADYTAGARYFEQALGIIDEVVAENDSLRIRLLLILGDAYILAGDDRHAKVQLNEIIRLLDKDPQQRQWLIAALGKLAEIHVREMNYGNALQLLKRASVEDKQQAGPRSHVSVRIAYLIGLSQVGMGQEMLAKSALNEAWTTYRTLNSPHPVLAFDILSTLSVAHQRLGEDKEAASAMRLAVKHCKMAFGINSNETVTALIELGVVCAAACEFDEAQRHLERSLSIARQLFGDEAVETIQPLAQLSALLMNVGHFEKAQGLSELRLSIAIRSFQDHPERITDAHSYLGSALIWRADYARARGHFDNAFQLLAPIEQAHPTILRQLFVGAGVLEFSEGKYVAAKTHIQKALQIRDGVSVQGRVQCLDLLARVNIALADYSSAGKFLTEAFGIPELATQVQQMRHAELLITRASLLTATEDYDSAEECAALALQLLKKSAPMMHHSEARALMALARLHFRLRRYDAAEKELSDALKIRTLRFGTEHPETAETIAELGHLYLETGNAGKATEYLSKALEIRQLKLGNGHPATAESQFRLAQLHCGEQHVDSALPLLMCALKTDQDMLGTQHPATILVASKLQELLLLNLGRVQDLR